MAVQFPKTRDLLLAWGIDASRVSQDGIDRDGYNELVIDPNTGKKVAQADGRFAAVRKPWPVGLSGETVLNMMLEDRADFHIANPVRVIPDGGLLAHPVDHVVLLRRRYDLDPTHENRMAYASAEKFLTKEEHTAYLALYREVSEPNTNQE